jgi:hypothetical protein
VNLPLAHKQAEKQAAAVERAERANKKELQLGATDRKESKGSKGGLMGAFHVLKRSQKVIYS